ncbi:hypothetical protein [Paenibacillus whitsoniae]|uniref:hypothetical protein n=1 Tax=Paenibacillus whitsoniae TaxID=2496558 RepID=UPI0013E08B06|nr:hypothetical protein [Paenibacillus whitsoniae]
MLKSTFSLVNIELRDFIARSTGINVETVLRVLEAENLYFASSGMMHAGASSMIDDNDY